MKAKEFNEYCAEVMGYLHKDGFFYQYEIEPSCKIRYNPYEDLNQTAEVVEVLALRETPPKPMWSNRVFGDKIYSGDSIKSILQEFIISTKAKP